MNAPLRLVVWEYSGVKGWKCWAVICHSKDNPDLANRGPNLSPVTCY